MRLSYNHDQLSDTYAIRKTVDMDNTEEYCEDGMVWLRCCHQWPCEACLSKSVLDGCCLTCGRTPSAVLGHEEVVKELLDHGVASTAGCKGRMALPPSFEAPLPYDILKPRGPASICEEGGYATVSLYLPDKAFVLKGSEVWVDGKCLSRRLSRLSVASIVREDAVYKRLRPHPLILNYDGKVFVNGNVYSLKIERALGCLRKFILSCPAPSKETRLAMAIQAAASISYPGSGSFEYPESNSVAKQEHAAHPPQDHLCPCWEFKIPTNDVYRGIHQGCNAKNCFLISLEVGEPVVAEPRHWSLEGCDGHINEGLHVQRPTGAQIVDEVQRCLFIWRRCILPGFHVYLVYANLELQLDRSSDIGRFM